MLNLKPAMNWMTQATRINEHVETVLQTFESGISLNPALATVVAVEQASSHALTIRLKPQWHWLNRAQKNYLAGQYISLGVEINGVIHERCYSLASSPGEYTATGVIELTVQRVEGGLVSNYLADNLGVNDYLRISQPAGELVFSPCQKPALALSPLLLIAGGSGITPLRSILLSCLLGQGDAENRQSVELFYSAKNIACASYCAELKALQEEYTNFNFHMYSSQQECDEAAYGRIKAADFNNSVQHDTHAYICGSAEFVGFVESTLMQLGLNKQNIASEAFTAAIVSEQNRGEQLPAQIEFKKSQSTIQSKSDASLLVLAEQAGLKPKHGCRMGICNSCQCVATGTFFNKSNGKSESVINKKIRPCIMQPSGSVSVEL